MKPKSNTRTFIEKARKVHGNKYDYSKVEYVKNDTKVRIICPTHGEFWQKPNNHLNGQGCYECGLISKAKKKSLGVENFIKRAKQVHDDKYDYSKVEYKTNRDKVCIICPKHGEFWQSPDKHLSGQGCPQCTSGSMISTKKKRYELFIKRAREVHADKYDYSKVEYKTNKDKVCIICPTHGEFLQRPDKHLSGQGCPQCKNSLIEEEILKLLIENNIDFLKNNRIELNGLELDFYLPQYNVAIECQGIQHFQPHVFFGGTKAFNKQVERDTVKRDLCAQNGIKLLYYSNLGIDYPYKVYENKEELLEEIKKGEPN